MTDFLLNISLYENGNEEICILILDMMADMVLIRRDAGDFAQDYTGQLMEQIIDPQIRSMHPMADCPV